MSANTLRRKTKLHYQVLETPTTLYLDDLEEIVNILAELSPEGLDIEDDEYMYGSLGDVVKNAGSPAHNLEISTRYSLGSGVVASVNIEAANIRVSVTNSGNATRGAFEAVVEILQKRRKPFAWLFSSLYFLRFDPSVGSYISAFLIETSFFGGLLFSILGYTAMFDFLAPAAVATVLVAFFLLRAIGGATYYRNEIRLLTKAQEKTFWKRNQDTIIVTLIGVVASALFALLFSSVRG